MSQPAVRWGTGYAEWSITDPSFTLHRRVWAPFGDWPAVRVDAAITAATFLLATLSMLRMKI